jgi:hypothetical protein
MSHGHYLLKGEERPMEIFEVGAKDSAPFVAPPVNHPSPGSGKLRRWNLFREFSLGMLALGCALLGKLALDQKTAWGARADLWFSAQLQRAVAAWTPSRAGEILLVDLADVRPQPVNFPPLPGEAAPRHATPRKELAEIIEAIAVHKPRAIAVDIDFSPWEDGRPATPEDPVFFERMLDASKVHDVPIYLGVYRQRFKEAREWLGDEKFSGLAAGIAVPSDPAASYYYVRWQWGYAVASPLANLALAAAEKKDEAGQDPPARWAFQAAQMREVVSSRAKPLGMMSWARVDLSRLSALESLSVTGTGTINDNRRSRGLHR